MRKNKNGFTLIELLVVIAIIGLLSTMTVAAVKMAQQRANIAKAQHDIDEIAKAIIILGNDTYQWPGHQPANQVSTTTADNEICGADLSGDDCAARTLDAATSGLVSNDGATAFPGWGGPYMVSVPIDAWGREYYFDTDYQIDINDEPCGCGGGGCTDAVVVGSYGPDGEGVPTGVADPDGPYGCDDIIKIIAK